MSSPSRAISATTVYEPDEVCSLLGIGDDKLREIVSRGGLRRLGYSNRWRFFGEELIRFCRGATGLPDFDYVAHIEILEAEPDGPGGAS